MAPAPPTARPKAPAAGDHRRSDPAAYRQRNVVERCFNRLNQFVLRLDALPDSS
ncbi:hypothetical protein [Amycolatopsis sp. CA-126428]|uniref:hypothetical protein n=1 Tax=Amycolatopsis sp. CA-126428 TaxID=2073158 RepID=UPI001304E7CD|nr:hypothetical protein [Amycolatopsis sp. CA-126428]